MTSTPHRHPVPTLGLPGMVLLFLMAACTGGDGSDPATETVLASLDGAVRLAAPEPVPPGSSLRVALLDVTLPGEPGTPVASMVFTVDSLPAPFSLPYGEDAIRHLRAYGLEIRLESDGEALHRTPRPVPLFGRDAGETLDVVLQPDSVAILRDQAALEDEARALDARTGSLERREGDGRRGDAVTRLTTWVEDGVPVVIHEEVDRGPEGSGLARYHLRNGRVFRYEEEGERWATDLTGAGRLAPFTLRLTFDPDGEMLEGVRTLDGARTDLPAREIEEVQNHIETLVEGVAAGG